VIVFGWPLRIDVRLQRSYWNLHQFGVIYGSNKVEVEVNVESLSKFAPE
jgi:hypothetical protein